MTREAMRAWLGGVGGAVVLTMATGAGEPAANPDYGFVLTDLNMLFHRGEDKIDCPQGRSPSLKDAYLATQTPAERARLLKPENAMELEQKYKFDFVFDAKGRDICTSPEAFDTPDRALQNTVQSRIGPGLDLDGGANASTCPHETFTSPSGETGVDNQYFRAIACNSFWRGAGESLGDAVGELHWTEKAVAVVVRDVQSWRDDPHVEVLIAASPDKAPTDASGRISDGGSVNLTDNSRYRVVMKGRIVDGVLSTEPANLVLPRNWVGASGGELILNHARLRVRMTPEGELKGEAGGYRPIDNAIAVMRVGGPGVANTAGVECASVRKTLRVLADGDRDPKTGQCTSVSMGLNFAAKPAFVFDGASLAGVPRAPGQTARR